MTGIERLRKLINVVSSPVLRDALLNIANQIERERDETYDIVLKENRETIAWVKKHGGIDFLDLHWGNMHRLVAEVARRLGYRSDCEDCEPDELLDALDRRLMPEGMEWPRFEDGEPVRIGDAAPFGDDDVMEVTGVELNRFGYVLHGSINDGMRECVDGDEHGVAVKRPAPKVLDADGAEIRAGETLFHVSSGESVTVRQLMYPDKFEDTEFVRHFASEYTHLAPVLAADGRPLREGETVWDVLGKRQFTVLEIGPETMLGGYNVNTLGVDGDGMGLKGWSKPSDLTHERPDSFALIEQDVELSPFEYAERHGRPEGMDCTKFQRMDLVRRARLVWERDA